MSQTCPTWTPPRRQHSIAQDSVSLRTSRLVEAQGETERVFLFSSLRRVARLGKPSFESAILYARIQANISVDWLEKFGRPVAEMPRLDTTDGAICLAQALFCSSLRALALASTYQPQTWANV